VKGLDFSACVQEHNDVGRRNNYVLGRLNHTGTWYAFPLMLVLKMPLALFGLLFLADRARPEHGQAWDAAFLFIPFAVILAFFSLWVRPQLGIRYILPGVIPLFVYAGRAAATTGRRTFLIRALVAWHAISVFSYHPDFMSYFNELIGPRVNAYHFLADSIEPIGPVGYSYLLFNVSPERLGDVTRRADLAVPRPREGNSSSWRP
jgi:hypothetical protein